jgi:Kef-type K+ transport system membrane component KefB
VLPQLALTLAVVIVLGQAIGRAFRIAGQPPVIGEVVAGILLGPSFLGALAPAISAAVLPRDVMPPLELVAQVGVVLYMFFVGLELNTDQLRGRVSTTALIALASTALPFAGGAAFGLYLYPRFSAADVPVSSFVLFSGVAMSITAFPVLARILSDQRLTRTELGSMALSTAAIADVTAWCLLAFVVGVVEPERGSALGVTIATAGFVAVMVLAVRPLVTRVTARSSAADPHWGTIVMVLAALAAAAYLTEAIGVHAIFGAFMLGAVIPSDSRLAAVLHGRFERLVTVLLLPAFFALTGMRTEIGLLDTRDDWAVAALVVLVATAGKVGSTLLAARLSGLGWRVSAALGVLMNTRGLMEIIVLNVGLALGVISPRLFTIFVLMAIVTTVATGPILRAIVGTTGTTGSTGTTGPR